MQTVSKALAYIILVCLLLSLVSGTRRMFPRANAGHHFGREHGHVLARLRRCRQDNLAPHPVRPCLNVLLPPDEDDSDRLRPPAKDAHERLFASCRGQTPPTLFTVFCSRPLPTEVPRHQAFCLLLI